MEIAFSEGERERERERAEREGRRELGIYSVTFTLISGTTLLGEEREVGEGEGRQYLKYL